MDEMAAGFESIVVAALGVFTALSVVMALGMGWLGWWQVRSARWAQALAAGSLLSLAVLGAVAMFVAGGMRSPLDGALFGLVFGIGPCLGGHALGSLAALALTPRAS